jgi:hypothetical protein
MLRLSLTRQRRLNHNLSFTVEICQPAFTLCAICWPHRIACLIAEDRSQIIRPADGGIPQVVPLTKHSVVMEAHRLCEPVKTAGEGKFIPVTLPERAAQMYLDMHDWKLPQLAGISTVPLLSEDGLVRTVEGYDPTTGLWCANVLPVNVPEQPTVDDASHALDVLRHTFRTFPFADAVRRREGAFDILDLAG